MHRDLALCRDGLRRVLDSISPTDAERARDGAWSIANIVEHLDLTYTRNAAGLERRLSKGDSPERKRTIRQAAIRMLIVTIGYFPPGRTAPTMVVPQGRRFTEVAAQILMGKPGHVSSTNTKEWKGLSKSVNAEDAKGYHATGETMMTNLSDFSF